MDDGLRKKVRDLENLVVNLTQHAAEEERRLDAIAEGITSHAGHLTVLHRIVIEIARQHPTVLDLVRERFKEIPDARFAATLLSRFDSFMADLNAPD